MDLSDTSSSVLPARVLDITPPPNSIASIRSVVSSAPTSDRISADHDLALFLLYRHCSPNFPASVAPGSQTDHLSGHRPLRKKPESISTTPSSPHPRTHMRRSSGITKTTSVPAFHLKIDPDITSRRPSSSSGSAHPPPPPLLRTYTHPPPHNNSHSRSPPQKKPPASHSSLGVETTCGPPPSYSTQKTLSQDKFWSVERSPSYRSLPSAIGERDQSMPHEVAAGRPERAASHDDLPPKHESQEPLPSRDQTGPDLDPPPLSSPETAADSSSGVPTPDLNMNRSSPPLGGGAIDIRDAEDVSAPSVGRSVAEDDSKGSSGDERKSEDLFLNIATSDATTRLGPPVSKNDKRRSRISLPFFSNNRPSTGHRSSPLQSQFDSLTPRSEVVPPYFTKRSSLGPQVPGVLSKTSAPDTHLHSDGLLAAPPRATSVVDQPTTGMLSRRHSNAHTDSARVFPRPSTARNSRLVSESNFNDRPRLADHNATESTISTTAPSTVWDELDDLKSRIRKLELTGKLPSSSAAAMSSTDRPRTATTAATTLSSSPKHKPGGPHLQSAIEGIPSTVHPLLHEALGNAKAVLSNEVYQKLQATAQDALQLSLIMNPEGFAAGGSTLGTPPVSERQVRRRTESMCRSLTELAIALLADAKGGGGVSSSSPANRPASRDAYQTSAAGLRSRRYSNEPVDRPPLTVRVQSRLDTRRTSAPLGPSSVEPPHSSPDHGVQQTPPTALPQIPSTSASRLGRSSTAVRHRRTQAFLDATTATDEDSSSPLVRPVSRAMTEVGTYRQMARDRANFSREYTSQHPMPASLEQSQITRTPMPAHVSSNLVSRRKYASPSSVVSAQDSSPLTAKEPWGRISIVPATTRSLDVTPEGNHIASPRTAASRRSLGFASRISSVGSRLRAAKAERNGNPREGADGRTVKEMAPSLDPDGSTAPQPVRDVAAADES